MARYGYYQSQDSAKSVGGPVNAGNKSGGKRKPCSPTQPAQHANRGPPSNNMTNSSNNKGKPALQRHASGPLEKKDGKARRPDAKSHQPKEQRQPGVGDQHAAAAAAAQQAQQMLMQQGKGSSNKAAVAAATGSSKRQQPGNNNGNNKGAARGNNGGSNKSNGARSVPASPAAPPSASSGFAGPGFYTSPTPESLPMPAFLLGAVTVTVPSSSSNSGSRGVRDVAADGARR